MHISFPLKKITTIYLCVLSIFSYVFLELDLLFFSLYNAKLFKYPLSRHSRHSNAKAVMHVTQFLWALGCDVEKKKKTACTPEVKL